MTRRTVGLHRNVSLLARAAKSGRVVGGMLVAGESACVELQVKNHSAKKVRAVFSPSLHCAHSCIDAGIDITLGRHLHLPLPAHGSGNHKKAPSPLQISDTLASFAFRGPEYTANPGTEGIVQLIFDVPRTAHTVSAHPRHGGDVDEDGGEAKQTGYRRYSRSAGL